MKWTCFLYFCVAPKTANSNIRNKCAPHNNTTVGDLLFAVWLRDPSMWLGGTRGPRCLQHLPEPCLKWLLGCSKNHWKCTYLEVSSYLLILMSVERTSGLQNRVSRGSGANIKSSPPARVTSRDFFTKWAGRAGGRSPLSGGRMNTRPNVG